MTTRIKNEYRNQRKEGYQANIALCNAKTKIEFDSNPNVKIQFETDIDAYDDSYLETWDLTESQLAKERKKLWDLIELEGIYGCVAYSKCPKCGNWEQVDSVWGFLGQNAMGYEYDLMNSALNKVIP